MRFRLAVLAVFIGLIAIALWASVGEAPWEMSTPTPLPSPTPSATLDSKLAFKLKLCEDALARRRALIESSGDNQAGRWTREQLAFAADDLIRQSRAMFDEAKELSKEIMKRRDAGSQINYLVQTASDFEKAASKYRSFIRILEDIELYCGP